MRVLGSFLLRSLHTLAFTSYLCSTALVGTRALAPLVSIRSQSRAHSPSFITRTTPHPRATCSHHTRIWRRRMYSLQRYSISTCSGRRRRGRTEKEPLGGGAGSAYPGLQRWGHRGTFRSLSGGDLRALVLLVFSPSVSAFVASLYTLSYHNWTCGHVGIKKHWSRKQGGGGWRGSR